MGMRSFFITAVTILLGCLSLHADSTSFFERADDFLGKYVEEGLVNYGAVSADSSSLNALVDEVASFDLGTPSVNLEAAFLINAYNLLVIHGVVSRWPVSSPLDIEGFFNTELHGVAGTIMTLDSLEQRLFTVKPDPRLHFVLVCGARGCPPILSGAYYPEALELQLQEASSGVFNLPWIYDMSDDSATIMLSEIFRWYGKDFGGSQEEMIEFIRKYSDRKLPAGNLQIEYIPYDWGINDH